MIEIAKKYIESGLSILPTKEDKSPATAKWINIDVDISEFINAYGIGIKCGKSSGGLECLDFDNHFNDAKETLTKFIEEIKELYDKYNFPIESTVSGGYHLLYRCSKIEGNFKLASKPLFENEHWRPDAIIETRGEGGYFVVDPTPKYKIIKNDILKIPTITSDERDLIISVAKSFNEWSETRKNEFENDDKPGDLFNKKATVSDVSNLLKFAGWNELRNGIWQRPGKKKGISATLGKVAVNIFYNFSANGHPFEERKAYTPFQVLTLLKYNGDFSACAKDLYAENKPIKQPEKKEIPEDKLLTILHKSLIDANKEIKKPPIIFTISERSGTSTIQKRVFTLGNFSAIIGKAKSKKTFFLSMVTASLVNNAFYNEKLKGDLPDNKRQVIYFDTEQGFYDGWITARRIQTITGKRDNFGYHSLREFSPLERCDIIEFALSKLTNIGFVIIDGIVDLATAINDEIEATRIVSLLLKWTKLYNCHIAIVIHQNKGDNFATGHLGSSIMKKAEAVISVTKDKSNFSISNVECDFIRGVSDFETFRFMINNDNLPEIIDNELKAEFTENEIPI